MNKARKHLLISLTIFAVAFLALATTVAVNANSTVRQFSEAIKQSDPVTIEPEQQSQKVEPVREAESAPVAPVAPETYQATVQAKQAPQAPPKQEMERIPFTDKPVEAGNPESYIGTYGQCPFYENAGEKGCTPPPDVQCNADWSQCEYVGTKQ